MVTSKYSINRHKRNIIAQRNGNSIASVDFWGENRSRKGLTSRACGSLSCQPSGSFLLARNAGASWPSRALTHICLATHKVYWLRLSITEICYKPKRFFSFPLTCLIPSYIWLTRTMNCEVFHHKKSYKTNSSSFIFSTDMSIEMNKLHLTPSFII